MSKASIAVPWRRKLFSSDASRSLAGVFGVLVLLIAVAPLISSALTPGPLTQSVVSLGVFTAVVAFGQFLVILVGGLDLSIPSVMTLAGVVLTSQTIFSGGLEMVGVLLVLAMGAAIGVVNGAGIVYLRVNPIVMTLATNVVIGGAVLVYTNGTPRGTAPEGLMNATQGNLWGVIPVIAIPFAIFVSIAVVVMRTTGFSRRVYAMGSNRLVAYLSGIAVNRLTITVYAISGCVAALGGILLTGSSGMSYLTLGDPYLLLSLAAVILGGVSISGGKGSYLAVVGGALVLMTISIIMSATSWPQSTRQIVYAIVIIAAVIASRRSRGK